jgi:hypothetical protein
VFDGTPEQLTTGAARDIYGADGAFSEAATSTEIETLDSQEVPQAEACLRLSQLFPAHLAGPSSPPLNNLYGDDR